jgi:CelD/BcsL family acetyltransferase involved in cellulose biosynthesis
MSKDGNTVKIVNTISPAPRGAWEEVFLSDHFALETQSPAWADAMCAAGGYEDASRLYVTANGRKLVLPLLRKPLVAGAVSFEGSNPPHCGVGGLLAQEGTCAEEIAAVFDDLVRGRAFSQLIYSNPLLASAWEASAPASATIIPHRAHLLDLEGGWEKVWSKRFKGSKRTAARRAENLGVTVECGTSGRLVPEFYQLLEQAAARWARLQHEPYWLAIRRLKHRDPREKFDAIGRLLGERCRVWLARVEGQAAAAIMVIQGVNAYYYRGAMDERLGKYRPNDLIQRLAIEDACKAGCRYYYMGDSGWSDSLAQFKEGFGAQSYLYSEFRLERLPLSRVEREIKSVIKRMIRFKDF